MTDTTTTTTTVDTAEGEQPMYDWAAGLIEEWALVDTTAVAIALCAIASEHADGRDGVGRLLSELFAGDELELAGDELQLAREDRDRIRQLLIAGASAGAIVRAVVNAGALGEAGPDAIVTVTAAEDQPANFFGAQLDQGPIDAAEPAAAPDVTIGSGGPHDLEAGTTADLEAADLEASTKGDTEAGTKGDTPGTWAPAVPAPAEPSSNTEAPASTVTEAPAPQPAAAPADDEAAGPVH